MSMTQCNSTQSNGKVAPLTWPVMWFRLTNNICWPLEDNASWFSRAFDRFFWAFGFVSFLFYNEAEIRYFRQNLNDMDAFLAGVPTYLVLVEIHIRCFTMGWTKENFKRHLKKFFAEIYIEESVHPKEFKYIHRQQYPIMVFSFFYFCTWVSYVIKLIYLLYTESRELLYYMIPTFDFTPTYIYVPMLVSNVWIGFLTTTIVYGQANVVGCQIFHLNGRYHLMKKRVQKKVEEILKENQGDIVGKFRQIVVETVKLNQFAQEIQNEFSFQLFISFSFMAITLCALVFKIYTSPMTSFGYMLWASAKIQEILAYGEMGSTIGTITNEISSMYYESKWECIIERSSDTRDNINTMKMIIMAMATNGKPIYISGLNFFPISLSSSVTIKTLQIQALTHFEDLISWG
ncbi:odorant receptor 74a-like [Haematobia irritans]|uniref:odorant receptor 74a-like n=1 Tax=Haematobia irritans TaxID=7368 RepID=UPI003F508196